MAIYALVNRNTNKVIQFAIADTEQDSAHVNWVNVTGIDPRPQVGATYNGGVSFTDPPAPQQTLREFKLITATAFWERFTNTERVNYDVASQHDPAATLAAKKDAAKLRLFKEDLALDGKCNLNKPRIRNQVTDLETAGVLAAGRALVILDTPITFEEAWV